MTRKCFPAALAALAVAAAGCGGDDDDTNGEETVTPTPVAMTATAEGRGKAIEVPETVEAGLAEITLTNDDEVRREAQLIRVEGDETVEDVLEVVNEQGGPIPDFMQDGGGVAPVDPGETATVLQVLQPGRYVVFDTGQPEEEEGPDNATLGATAEFTVEGDAGDASLPEADGGTITAVDYDFQAEGLRAGRNVVRFENTGEELHHAILFPINEGVPFEDVREAFSSEEGPDGPPPVDFAGEQGTTVIDGGVAQNVELELQAGRYAALCFIQDREGGPPHVAMGMIAELEVE